MVDEEGIVEKVVSTRAIVRIQRNSCCAGCHSEGTGGACRPSESKEMTVEAINGLKAQVGDRVRISLPTGSLLKVSFIVYFIPVITLILGAALGSHLAPAVRMDGALASILAGVLCMALTFVFVRRFDRGIGAKEEYWPHITRILPPLGCRDACSK